MKREWRYALLALGLALAGLAVVLVRIWWAAIVLAVLACWALASVGGKRD